VRRGSRQWGRARGGGAGWGVEGVRWEAAALAAGHAEDGRRHGGDVGWQGVTVRSVWLHQSAPAFLPHHPHHQCSSVHEGHYPIAAAMRQLHLVCGVWAIVCVLSPQLTHHVLRSLLKLPLPIHVPLLLLAARGGGPLGVARADSFTVMSSPDVAAARAAAGAGAGPRSAAGEAPGAGAPSPYVSAGRPATTRCCKIICSEEHTPRSEPPVRAWLTADRGPYSDMDASRQPSHCCLLG
jgi:hypothetical protein